MNESKRFLLIMRHAESESALQLHQDFDRPLTSVGKEQPITIAKALNDRSISVDVAIISPSRRTAETWQIMSSYLNGSPKVHFDERLYQAFAESFLSVIQEHERNAGTMLIIAHCPAVIEVCQMLSGRYCEFKPASLAILGTGSTALTKRGGLRLEEMLMAGN